MKKCNKCNLEKSKNDFYGLQGECKECTKKRVREREAELRNDPAYVEKERKRGREKYHRLGYSNKPQSKNKKIIMENYKNKYPEKIGAKNKCSHIRAPKGLEKHHWNYNEGFEKDIIFLIMKVHNKLHRYSIYDQERMMYRKLSGELIDTRKKCENYIEEIKDLD